jgi:DNA-binding NarL/FixJ family response regulator
MSVLAQSRDGAPALAGAHVLVVEDDAQVRSALGRSLEREGATVELARSFGTALAALRDGDAPDAALLDLALPGGFGLQLSRWLHEKRCAWVVLSGYAHVHLEEALRAGAWDVLAKPATREEVLAAVASAVDRTQWLRSRFAPPQEADDDEPVPSTSARTLAACLHDDPTLERACAALRKPLTTSEGRLLCALTHGLSEPEAAARIGISPHTARKLASAVRSKLGLGENRIAVALFQAELSRLLREISRPS